MMSKNRKITPYPLHSTNNPLLSSEDNADLDIFIHKPFWIFDQSEHNKQYRITNGNCCFQHLVGLPERDGKQYPIFPFQEQIYDAIEHNQSIWILKARAIGITTFLIRYLAWKILSTNELDNKSIFIISGTRQEHANFIKEQIERLFVKNFPNLKFDSKYTEMILKRTWIKVFPTKNIRDVRGYFQTWAIWVDESDHMDPKIQEELFYSIGPYQLKSKSKIILSSTANRPDGLMQTIEKDTSGKWTKLKLDYTYGLGTMYQPIDIERMKNDVEFDREMRCFYLGKIGNVVLPNEIENCISLGKLYKNEPIGEQTLLSCGIDWGFSSSATGIVLLERIRPIDNATNRIQDLILVRHSELIEKGNVNVICDNLFNLYRKHHNTWFITDGSNRSAVNLLKIKLGESLNWDSNELSPDNMKVVPVNFGTSHKDLLSHMQSIVSNGYLAIPEESNQQLLTALRTAYAKELSLDKTQSVYNDLTDALRLSLKAYNIK